MRSNPTSAIAYLLPLIVIAVAATSLTCSCSSKTPFSLKMGDINEGGRQQDAAIELADAQIYARESLVNDRRREAALLEKLLEESESETFEPEILRSVLTLRALSTELAGTFDPSVALGTGRAEELARLDQKIAVEERRQRLAKARGGEGASSNDSSSTSDEEPQSDGDDPDDSQPDQAAQLKALRERLDALQASTAAFVSDPTQPGKPVSSAASAAPRDRFRDLQAYRRELRAALAEVRLDDLHDYSGNALYRLQFRATVMPGRRKDKFGLARLTMFPPQLSDEELSDVYWSWLAHVTLRSNGLDAQGNVSADPNYESLAAATGLVKFLRLPFPYSGAEGRCETLDEGFAGTDLGTESGTEDDESCGVIRVAFPGELGAEIAPLLAQERGKELIDIWEDGPYHFERSFGIDSASCQDAVAAIGRALNPDDPVWDDEVGREAVDQAVRLLQNRQVLSRSAQGLMGIPGHRGAPSHALGVLERLQHVIDVSDTFLSLLEVHVDQCEDIRRRVEEEAADRVANLPGAAFRNLLMHNASASGRRVARGQARAYSTSPVELAQTLSSVARAANRLETALALSATLPQYGLGVDAAADYLRDASGAVEMRERTPLVVGFASRCDRVQGATRPCPESPVATYAATAMPKAPPPQTRADTDNAEPGPAGPAHLPQFGWVFGPRVRLDASRDQLLLEQSVAPYDVAADVSIPGWWPRVHVALETVWVQNWHDTQNSVRHPAKVRHFEVPLPLSRSDLDGLTDLIAQAKIGRTLRDVRIAWIDPWQISACGKELTLLVHGSNVWRSTEVYLGGIKAKTVSILPNMEGVAANFDLDELYESNQASPTAGLEDLNLVVATRDGSDSTTVSVVGRRYKGSCEAPRAATAALKLYNDPRILDVSPQALPACARKATIVVAGEGLADLQDAFFTGGTAHLRRWSDTRAIVALERLRSFGEGSRTPTLTLATENGLTDFNFGIAECGGSPAD